MSIQRNITRTYKGALGAAKTVATAAMAAGSAFAAGGGGLQGLGAAAAEGGSKLLFGSSSIEFDRMIGEQAMQRVQAQTEAKIPKSIDPDGGKDGSETT